MGDREELKSVLLSNFFYADDDPSVQELADAILRSEWFKNRLREERDLGLELAKVAAYMYGMDDSKWRALVKMQHGSAIVKAIDEEKQRYEEWLENHDTE